MKPFGSDSGTCGPEEALCDRDQALGPDDLAELVARLETVVPGWRGRNEVIAGP